MKKNKRFRIYQGVDYQELMKLFDEFKLEVRDVKTVDYEDAYVIGEGEERYVEFVAYLHEKYLTRMLQMRNKLRLTEKSLKGKVENEEKL